MNVEEIIGKMSLRDKIRLCSGENFWETKGFEEYGIPSMFMCDGPHGLRKQERENGADMLGINNSRAAACFPAEVTTAGSWDPELLEEIGAAIAEEAREQGVGLVLGPGANIKRNPLCGRNFEYFSEDPFLAGKLAAGFIRGIESKGTACSLKHFAVNSQETSRFNSDSVLDERTLREIYLTAFETAVKEGKPSTVMCAYPKLNGTHCSDSKTLLTDILRDEWGFDGMVVTDWGAMNDRIEGFRAGCDLNMPGGSDYMEKEVLDAVKSGVLPESAVDKCAERVLKLVFRAAENSDENFKADMDKHHKLAVRAAEQGAVLLKNDRSLLPLQSLRHGENIVLIGNTSKTTRYQGAGSSHINPARLVSLPEAMTDIEYTAGYNDDGSTDEKMIAAAVSAAKKADKAVVILNLPDCYESEGFDRDDMKLPDGEVRLIEAVAAANPNTAAVLFCGCAVECPWADKVGAILYMGLPGQGGGEAAANLLYGKANPGGRLAESWPYSYEDCVSSPYYGKTKDALYLEGIYVGYRYYDKAGKKVRYPFGYGLSYTSFRYSDMTVRENSVSVRITNTGSRVGSETAQLYIEAPRSGIHRPLKELKGFKKVFLQPGESAEAVFLLNDRSFAVWRDCWRVPEGEYTLSVGGSSDELPLKQVIFKKGETIVCGKDEENRWYSTFSGTPGQDSLEAEMGRKYTPPELKKGLFTMDNSVMEMKDHSLIMKIMYKAVESTVAKGFGGKKDYSDPQFRMLMASSAGGPLRSMQISGGIKGGLFKGLLEMANGHFLRGIAKMIKG